MTDTTCSHTCRLRGSWSPSHPPLIDLTTLTTVVHTLLEHALVRGTNDLLETITPLSSISYEKDPDIRGSWYSGPFIPRPSWLKTQRSVVRWLLPKSPKNQKNQLRPHKTWLCPVPWCAERGFLWFFRHFWWVSPWPITFLRWVSRCPLTFLSNTEELTLDGTSCVHRRQLASNSKKGWTQSNWEQSKSLRKLSPCFGTTESEATFPIVITVVI